MTIVNYDGLFNHDDLTIMANGSFLLITASHFISITWVYRTQFLVAGPKPWSTSCSGSEMRKLNWRSPSLRERQRRDGEGWVDLKRPEDFSCDLRHLGDGSQSSGKTGWTEATGTDQGALCGIFPEPRPAEILFRGCLLGSQGYPKE